MTGHSYVEVVTVALKKLGLLSPTGTMLRVDSLTLVDFIVELEDGSGLRIDVAELTDEAFESIETLAEMLTNIAQKAS